MWVSITENLELRKFHDLKDMGVIKSIRDTKSESKATSIIHISVSRNQLKWENQIWKVKKEHKLRIIVVLETSEILI